MTIRAMLLPCGLLLALASSASAQTAGPPPASLNPPAALDQPAPPYSQPALNQPGLPPQRILAIVRATGFDPVGRPVRRGNLYVQRALDPNDIEYRLVIDSLTGRTVSIRPIGMPGGPYGPGPAYGPYARYQGPIYGGLFGPADDGFGYGTPRPPHAVPHARLPPPQPSLPTQTQTQTQTRPQPSTTAQAPLPRPRPYVMEATGSIPADAPTAPAPQKAPDLQKTPEPPKAAPQDNGAAALPPVAPLD